MSNKTEAKLNLAEDLKETANKASLQMEAFLGKEDAKKMLQQHTQDAKAPDDEFVDKLNKVNEIQDKVEKIVKPITVRKMNSDMMEKFHDMMLKKQGR